MAKGDMQDNKFYEQGYRDGKDNHPWPTRFDYRDDAKYYILGYNQGMIEAGYKSISHEAFFAAVVIGPPIPTPPKQTPFTAQATKARAEDIRKTAIMAASRVSNGLTVRMVIEIAKEFEDFIITGEIKDGSTSS